MRLLAIDTSGPSCSAALLLGGEVIQQIALTPRRQGELILGMMQSLLDQAGLELKGLDALAFGRGPGSFTGVRIAAAVIQGAAFGAGLPVVPISTLAAIAQGQFRRSGHRRILATLDARMDEVYWGYYEIGAGGLALLQGAEKVCAPERVELPPDDGWYGVGSGWGMHGAQLSQRLGGALTGSNPEAICEAEDIARLAAADFGAGHWVEATQALPVYLRDRVTQVQPMSAFQGLLEDGRR
ncbi:tRNA (adenosine(37)-N6)-threonylcarbamoyltransferase complex dimerization subunit type 1 TsaB [Caldichromatium japonicum]|uniref:tRNA threonylcarbamoyladenosine biosynthesis protein TsaB n=1 Tax=Caldichromatium japonicum TaxID=2699430 RepID=A0A6G7VB33_9GAMM|nr:tRNA (adenosine(37)-N6)-threonylcarbamoyltransferase complex dimerization subunit type 1 TsaB [Caldichromatium japonicum]QIK37085.1 tRNA (adenosine(37)-N6)-threonylcarbamoyltransferase complex dimerization subunit type 1 TsaB [Caldichromatium japonicum]